MESHQGSGYDGREECTCRRWMVLASALAFGGVGMK